MEYYLAHHGVKGQKWGVRRYQNPDGTLTAEGIKRYGYQQNTGLYLNRAKYYKDQRKALKEEYKESLNGKKYNKQDFEKYLQENYKGQLNRDYEEFKRDRNTKIAMGVGAGVVASVAAIGVGKFIGDAKYLKMDIDYQNNANKNKYIENEDYDPSEDDDEYLDTGFEMNRIERKDANINNQNHAYVNLNKEDARRYRAVYGSGEAAAASDPKKITERKYVSDTTLKIAGRKAVKEAVKEAMNNNGNNISDIDKAVYNKYDGEKPKYEKAAVGGMGRGVNPVSNEVERILKNKGYDGVKDFNDRDANLGKQAALIFEPGEKMHKEGKEKNFNAVQVYFDKLLLKDANKQKPNDKVRH